jgi:hypothetical protein
VGHPDWLEIFYLPANTTSLIQPLDGGIIASVKLRYRKQLLQYLLERIDADAKNATGRHKKGAGKVTRADEYAKTVDVSKAMHMAKRAWDEVDPDLIHRVWKSTLLEAKPDRLLPGDRKHRVAAEIQEVKALLDAIPAEAASGASAIFRRGCVRGGDPPR